MTPFNRMLLCYDGTPEGRQALRCGAALARELQAETHLLAVVDSSWWTSGYDVLSSMAFEMDEDAARSILEEGTNRLSNCGLTVQGQYCVGDPIDRIATIAGNLRVDLIVIGHHRAGPFARWWTGERHAQLLDRVACGVLFEISR
ncbi:universal stress protein [Paraburkholderia hospita]|uniref:universal stress protein n=1 Tax=Paraburkholderia hospita TaxID=169430 RepID=UPI003ECF444B